MEVYTLSLDLKIVHKSGQIHELKAAAVNVFFFQKFAKHTFKIPMYILNFEKYIKKPLNMYYTRFVYFEKCTNKMNILKLLNINEN